MIIRGTMSSCLEAPHAFVVGCHAWRSSSSDGGRRRQSRDRRRRCSSDARAWRSCFGLLASIETSCSMRHSSKSWNRCTAAVEQASRRCRRHSMRYAQPPGSRCCSSRASRKALMANGTTPHRRPMRCRCLSISLSRWRHGSSTVCRSKLQRHRLNLRAMTVTCPAGEVEPISIGSTVELNAMACDRCALREQCTTAAPGTGRSVQISDDERLQQRLGKRIATPKGREQLRERVQVEHKLAHIGQRQGRRARYFGVRANRYDLRRASSIQSLETTQRKMAA